MSKDEGKKPAAKKPAAKPPIAKKPAAKKPAAKKPAAKKPAAKKPAAKQPAAKASAAKALAAKKATAKAPTGKKPAAKKPTASAAPAAVSPADQAALAARVDAAWTKLEAWLGKNATPVAERMKKAKGSTAAEIAKAEAAFGAAAPWPADVRAHFARYGAVSGAVFYEYEALTLQRAVASGRGFDKLVDDGTFGKFTPHELDPGPKKIRFTWWHRGWLPIAEDGGGNLLCVDLDPDTKGRFGQIINWEMHGGPVGPVSGSLAEHLEKYAKTLASGKLTYDVDSGIFM